MQNTGFAFREWVHDLLIRWGIAENLATKLDGWVVLIAIILLVLIVNIIMRWGVLRLVHRMVEWTRFTWDNILFDDRVLRRLSGVVTSIVISLALPVLATAFDAENTTLYIYLGKAVDIYIIITCLLFLNEILKALFAIMVHRPAWQDKPIGGLLQTCQVILGIIGIILVIATIINKSPVLLLTGIGASAAVISFIFKDTLMGLVAGVQLSANNMLKVGDWIEMPNRGIDGVVTEVSLTTIKVRSWNNTIQTLPPYLLVSEPFSNWQAMRDTGGRRIKRSLNIDTTSVQLLNDDMLARFNEDKVVGAVVATLKTTTEEGATITNLELYMRYITAYINGHPRVNHMMLSMVRQLQPSEWGLPIELYFFSADVNWVAYEHLQTEIISHIVAVASHFDIRLYQAPSSLDLRS